MAGDFGSSGPMDRGGRASPAIRGAPAYALAIAGIVAATAARAALDPLLGGAPYATYFAAAIAVFQPGGASSCALLEAAIGGVAGAYLFVEPRRSIEGTTSGTAGLVLYLLLIAATLVVLRSLREARATAERRQAELLAAEAAVRAQREAFRATLASIAEAVVATDRDGRVTFLNGVAERLLDVGPGGAAGRRLGEVIPAAGLADEVLDRALRRGQVFAPAGPIDLAGPGATIPVEVVASPIRGDGDGEALGAVVVLRDVSAARRIAAELGGAKEARRGRQPRQGPLPRGPRARAPHAADARPAPRQLSPGRARYPRGAPADVRDDPPEHRGRGRADRRPARRRPDAAGDARRLAEDGRRARPDPRGRRLLPPRARRGRGRGRTGAGGRPAPRPDRPRPAPPGDRQPAAERRQVQPRRRPPHGADPRRAGRLREARRPGWPAR